MDKDMSFIINNKNIQMPLFIKIIFLFLLILFIFLLNYKISLYNTFDARIIRMEDSYYVEVLVPMDIQTFIQNNKFLVDNKEYEYEIDNINEEYVFYNNKNYMLVNITSNLDKSYNIENNYLKIKQPTKKDTIFNILLKKLKKGMNL